MANVGALTVLRNNALFRELPRQTLEQLSDLCTNRQYAKGEILFVQGDAGDSLYGVIAGEVRISANSSDGQEMHLNVIRPGEVIGEIALLDGGERSATATATKASTLFRLPRDAFLRLLDSEPGFASHLLVLLCQRVRWTSDIIEDVVFRSVPMRLARRVAILARLHGEPGEDGVVLRLSQNDLARFLHVSRQVVNANLQEWQKAGFIGLSRGAVVVKDFDGLEASTLEAV